MCLTPASIFIRSSKIKKYSTQLWNHSILLTICQVNFKLNKFWLRRKQNIVEIEGIMILLVALTKTMDNIKGKNTVKIIAKLIKWRIPTHITEYIVDFMMIRHNKSFNNQLKIKYQNQMIIFPLLTNKENH